MAIEQKLIVNKSKTSNHQIILRDETGTYSPSNPGGYGGNNGTPVSEILKYVFVVKDLKNNLIYTQVQSDDLANTDEYHNPSIPRIANKEDVYIDASNFNLEKFQDGIYKIDMYTVIDEDYEGDGFQGTDVIVNTEHARALYNYYDGIFVDGEVYSFESRGASVLVLDKVIAEEFHVFKPILKASVEFILIGDLEDCINNKIAQMASNCDCGEYDTNVLVELQLLLWGLKYTSEKEDILQASEYIRLATKLCKSSKCNC